MIAVVAAIIFCEGRFLLARRPQHKHQGGKWEFPGGKKESGETSEAALIRECKEELNITIDHPEFFHALDFDYGDKQVALEFFLVEQFSGNPCGQEQQEVAWFDLQTLLNLEFPEANQPVLALLKEKFG